MPIARINKKTEKILIMKKQNTGIPKTKLIELAIINLPRIEIKDLNVKITIKKKK